MVTNLIYKLIRYVFGNRGNNPLLETVKLKKSIRTELL